MAQTGGLDAALTSEQGCYSSDYTKPLLFLADGDYLASKADDQHLSGDRWGMLNQTGNSPGQGGRGCTPSITSGNTRGDRRPGGPLGVHPRKHQELFARIAATDQARTRENRW